MSSRIRSGSISVEWVEEGDNQVDNDGQVEEDLTPDGHVRADPKEERLSSSFQLSFHLVNRVVDTFENWRQSVGAMRRNQSTYIK